MSKSQHPWNKIMAFSNPEHHSTNSKQFHRTHYPQTIMKENPQTTPHPSTIEKYHIARFNNLTHVYEYLAGYVTIQNMSYPDWVESSSPENIKSWPNFHTACQECATVNKISDDRIGHADVYFHTKLPVNSLVKTFMNHLKSGW